jgi:hypothetical protein
MSVIGDFATVTLLTVFNSELVTFAALAGSIDPLGEELNDSGFEVVHRACNLYAAGGFEIP